jgi:hypothetical protein
MNASFMNKHTKLAFLSCLLAALFNLSARAGFYPNTFDDSGVVPQGGTVLSFEHTIGPIAQVIESIQLILTFNDKSSLFGNNTGIQGHLNLGTGTGDPFVNFYPDVTRTSAGNRIYDVTWSTAPTTGFNGLDPNNTWALVLWDNSTSGIENSLVSWSLNITAVPEPVTVALGIFAGVFLVVIVVRSRLVRNRVRHWRAAAVEWINAV